MSSGPVPPGMLKMRAHSRITRCLAVLAQVVANEQLGSEMPLTAVPASTPVEAAIHVSKPWKKRIVKNDLYHKLMRQARKYKHPTAQQLYKSKTTRKKYSVRNKAALKKRNSFVYKIKKRMHLTSTLALIAESLNNESV